MAEVVVALPKAEDTRTVRSILIKNGYSVIGTATSGAGALSLTDELNEGILICAYKFADMVYSELKDNLNDRWQMMLVCNPSKIQGGMPDGVVFVPLPLHVHELIDTVAMMDRDMYQRRRRRRSMPSARSEKDKKIIYEAKSLLMSRNHMTEDEAHRYLQKTSMANGSDMVETAMMVISINRI